MKAYNLEGIEGTLEYGGIVKQALAIGDSAQMSCGTLTLRPGESMKEFENHRSDEIFFIASGELKIEARQGENVSAHQGQIVHIPKEEWHLSSNPGHADTVLFWINRD